MELRKFTLCFLLLFGLLSTINAQQFSPSNISALSLWLRGDTLIKDSATFVTRWNNIVDTGIVFQQTTTAFRPLKVGNALNGQQVLRFDGTNDFLSAGDTLDMGTLSRTIFVVGGKLSANPLGSFIAKARAANVVNRYGLYSDNTGLNFLYHDNANKNILVNPAPAKMNILSANINRTTQTVKLYSNSVQIGTTATGIQNASYNHNSTNRLLVGGYGNATDAGQVFPLNGDIAEILFYDRALADTERTQVEQYLRLKYAPQINLGPDSTITSGFCNITLASSGTFTNYLWSTGATTTTISINKPGKYWVRAVDIFGYFTSDTIEVKYAEEKPMPDTTICIKDTITLSLGLANGLYTYLWSTSATTPSIKTSVPGTFSVRVSDGSCFFYDTVIVTLDSFSQKISLGPDTAVCSGNLLGLQTGSSLVTGYLWGTGQTTPTISINAPGNYTLTATNIRGCLAKDTIAVTIKGVAPTISFNADTVCKGLATSFTEQISVQPPALLSSITWKFTASDSSVASNPTFKFSSSGVYNVQLTAITNVGCNSSFAKDVLVKSAPMAAFDLLSDACVNNGYVFNSTSTVAPGDNITSYNWNFGDNSSVGTPQTSHTYSVPGPVSVTLIVQNQNLCYDTLIKPLNVVSTAPSTGNFNLLNPANGYISSSSATITFTWSKSNNAQSYLLQLSTDSLFVNIVQASGGITGTATSLSNIPANNYYWRVLAINICGQQTIGEYRKLTILNISATPDIELWLRSDSLLHDSAGYISIWNNIIDTGISLKQPSTIQRPLLVGNILNGKPVIRFDGTNDFLSAGDTLDIGTHSKTFFIVGGKLAANASGSFFAKAKATNAVTRYGLYSDNTGLNYIYHDAVNKSILVNPAPPKVNIYSSTVNRTTLQLKLFANSQQIGTSNSIQNASFNFNSTNRFLVGAYGNATDNGEVFFLNGDIAEVLFYNRALSDSERTQIEQYLRFRYAPQINLGPDTTVAYGFCKLTLNAGNFTNYLWSTGEVTQTIDINKAGTYWVRALDIFGYVTSDTIKVSYLSEKPIADTTVCTQDTAILNPGITGAYTFLWNTSETTPTIKTDKAGIYSVKITDNLGCIFNDTAIVFIDSFSKKISLGADSALCSGNSIGLQTGASLPSTYLWNTTESTPTIIVTNPGTYSLYTTNSRGCSARDTIIVSIKGIAPTIDFTADSVCVGAATSFAEQISVLPPAVISNELWNFTATDSSAASNPSFVFPASGNFNVRLTVTTDVGCNSSIVKAVFVKSKPAAAFSLLIDACINNSYSFISNSTAAPDDILTAFNWNFGDNTFGSSAQANHTYTTPGSFNVQLTVTNQNGCIDTITKALNVVSSAPQPGAFNLLTPPNGYVDQEGDPITFTWSNSINAQLYVLQLATDIQFSNIVSVKNGILGTNTTINGLSANTYYWRVIASNICGQQSIGETRQLKILNIRNITDISLWLRADSLAKDSAGFVYNWHNIIDTGIQFLQTSASSRPGKINNTLNGKTVLRFDGSNDFLSAGDTLDIGTQSRTFFVVGGKLASNSSGSFFAKSRATNATNRYGLYSDNTGLNFVYHDAVNKTILVNPAPPKLNILSSTVDRANQLFKLFANSQQIGVTATGIQNASYNFNSASRLLVGAYGNSNDNGETFLLNGDIAEVIFYNKALTDPERTQVEQYLRFRYAPQINLGPDIAIAYGACDTTLRVGAFFTKIRWSTGDTTLTTKVKKAGKYWVSALDYFGYVTSDTINVNVPYSGITPAGGDTICIGSSTTLQYAITGSPYHFLWSTNDTTASIIVTTEGKYSVLVSDTNGCSTRDTVTVLVDSISLFSALNTDTTTCKYTPIGLTPYKFPYKTYNWSTGSTSDTTILTATGAVSVTVTDIAGCSTSDTINVLFKGIKPDVNFILPNTCLGDSSIYIDSSQAFGTEQLILWKWNFGNGDTATANTNKTQTTYYSSGGIYVTTLTVTTDSGCSNTVYKSTRVNPTPAANFVWNIACAGSPTNFVDKSTIAITDTINSWEWNIDGTFSSAKNPGILFPSQGEFQTTLIVTTNFGCADTVSRTVEVFAPLIADFDSASVCLGDTLALEDKTNSFSVINWLWSFGDGSPFALTQNTSHKYLAAGTYEVVLKIENSIGCKDTVARNIVVVAKPLADFTSSPACLGQSINLTDNSASVSESITKWNWNINGQSYNIQNPSVLFSDTGQYSAKLIVQTTTGCKDSITKQLSVKPLPNAAFTFTPLYGEAPVTATFTNISTGATSYVWDFGDGSADTTKNAIHIYQSNADFNITLNAISAFGCEDSTVRQFIVRPTTLNLLVEDISTQLVQQGSGSLIQTSVRLANVGTRLITNTSLYATLGNNGIITEEWNGLLQPGQIILYTFNSKFVLPARHDKTYVCVEAVSVNNGEEESTIVDNRSCTTIDGKAKLIGPYPNPVNGDSKLSFVLAKSETVTITIYDTYGHTNYTAQQSLPKGRTDITLPSSGFMAGTYYVKVQFADESHLVKFIVLN
jgi:PKD repeat protein